MDHEISPPKLLASTGDFYSCSITDTGSREDGSKPHVSSTKNSASLFPKPINESSESNFFKSVQWSPDGTCLLTTSADNTFRTFVLPPDLLSPTDESYRLTPYHKQSFPEPISTLTPYPQFTLSSPATCLVLTSIRDHPITLSSALYPSANPFSSYFLITPTTEAYLTPASLIFNSSGTTFLAGTDCLISLFDVSRNGAGPIVNMPTIPSKRHKLKGGGVGMRGIVSALALQNSQTPEAGGRYGESEILAAGTWNRWVGLYDITSSNSTIANFSIANHTQEEPSSSPSIPDIGGQGISQVLWSPCNRYLIVAERKSRGALVYDIRVTGKLLGWLEGREAETNQRLGLDVCMGDEGKGGFEVWAGGTDGVVKVWEGVGGAEGGQKVEWEWSAGNDSITSTVVHPSRTVVATSSGQRKGVNGEDEDDGDSDSENSAEEDSLVAVDNRIKVWGL